MQKQFDWNREDLVSQYDELPLWSSPFGLLLLDNLPFDNFENYLDVACGTGFPLIDISQRIGAHCKCIGIDPWRTAVNRIRSKIDTLSLKNIELIEGCASNVPFPDNHFDLITINLGVNNFSKPIEILSECYRVIKKGSPLCITSNLTGHFEEFYNIFTDTLKDVGIYDRCIKALEEHISHRGTINSHTEMIIKAGFNIDKVVESEFFCRFLNGTAFLNHSFIVGGFSDAWRNIIGESEEKVFFDRLENNLNQYSKGKDELRLKVPMVYIESRKI